MISDADDSAPPKLVGRTQRILLELSTIFYFFARNAAIPLVQQYVYHLVARKYNLTESEAAAAADADEGLRPVTNSSTGDKLVLGDQLQTATDGRLVCSTSRSYFIGCSQPTLAYIKLFLSLHKGRNKEFLRRYVSSSSQSKAR